MVARWVKFCLKLRAFCFSFLGTVIYPGEQFNLGPDSTPTLPVFYTREVSSLFLENYKYGVLKSTAVFCMREKKKRFIHHRVRAP